MEGQDGRSCLEEKPQCEKMSDSACSLQEGGSLGTARVHETWLVQELCSLGTLQVVSGFYPLSISTVSLVPSLMAGVPLEYCVEVPCM